MRGAEHLDDAVGLVGLGHERRRQHDLLAGGADDYPMTSRVGSDALGVVAALELDREHGADAAHLCDGVELLGRLQPVEQARADLDRPLEQSLPLDDPEVGEATAAPTGWPL